MIQPWTSRPTEQARLFNPAFLGTLLGDCAKGYATVNPSGLPYTLAFLAMPIVLHKNTREALPRAIITSLAAWLGQNPQAHVGFAERARTLVPVVKEAVIFASNGGLLQLKEAKLLYGKRPKTMTAFKKTTSKEVADCIKRAEFVGKWFAHAGDDVTVLALWGVAP